MEESETKKEDSNSNQVRFYQDPKQIFPFTTFQKLELNVVPERKD